MNNFANENSYNSLENSQISTCSSRKGHERRQTMESDNDEVVCISNRILEMALGGTNRALSWENEQPEDEENRRQYDRDMSGRPHGQSVNFSDLFLDNEEDKQNLPPVDQHKQKQLPIKKRNISSRSVFQNITEQICHIESKNQILNELDLHLRQYVSAPANMEREERPRLNLRERRL